MSGTVSAANPTPSVALVTGASRGIGLAIAQEVSRFYSEMIMVARSAEGLCLAAKSLQGGGRRAHGVPTDLAKSDQTDQLIRFVENQFASLDLLVHAAGAYDVDLLASDPETDLMAVNYEGPARLTVGLLPLLKSAKGQIVFINSTQGLRAGRHVGAYAASKHALRAFADSLRAEVNADGIRVLTVFAGSTATSMQARIYADQGRTYRPDQLMQPSDIALMVAAALRVPKTAEVVELTIRPMIPSQASV